MKPIGDFALIKKHVLWKGILRHLDDPYLVIDTSFFIPGIYQGFLHPRMEMAEPRSWERDKHTNFLIDLLLRPNTFVTRGVYTELFRNGWPKRLFHNQRSTVEELIYCAIKDSTPGDANLNLLAQLTAEEARQKVAEVHPARALSGVDTELLRLGAGLAMRKPTYILTMDRALRSAANGFGYQGERVIRELGDVVALAPALAEFSEKRKNLSAPEEREYAKNVA